MIIKSKLPNLDIPDKTFHDFLFHEWEKFREDVALIDNDTFAQFTFQDVMQKADFIAKSLVYLKVEKSEVVLLVMDWSPAAIYIALGASMAGAAIQVVSPKLQAWEMQFPVKESESRFVFSDPLGLHEIDKLMKTLNREYRIICTGSRDFANGYPIIEDLAFAAKQNLPLPKIEPDTDIVYLPYSSGIHGKRKGIVTTHKVMVAKTMVMWNTSKHHEFRRGDTTLTMIPLHKQCGLDAILCALLNGLTVVTEKNFCVHTFMTCIQRYKIRAVHLTPYLMNLMMFEAENHTYNIESLEWVVTGADAVTEELYEEFTEIFPSVKTVTQTYGMTEVGLICRTYNKNYSPSCGQLTANLEMKVLDILTGKELGPREKGQICVKGIAAESPYLNNPKATEEHFLDGWRRTGDIGFFDEEGNVHLVDKLKEMIKVFGYQVIPKEIETLLLTHQAVEEAAVVAINNELSGERPVAFVVLKKGFVATEDDLKDYVNKRVIRYKHLVRVNITQFLPKSACGTLLRRLLAEAAVMSVASIAELEDQNERLRAQNLRCTTQLQMLRSFTEKSRKIKAEMEMSRSITGTLPVLRDENRTSDDSGLTSDDADRKQMSVSISECTPRVQRKAARTMLKNTSQGSSTSESSPCEDEAKPMPLPRRIHPTATERDSLNSYAEDYEYDIEESSFERHEEQVRNENEKYVDYVNLHEFVAIKDDKVVYSEIVKHRSTEKEYLPALPSHQPRQWENRLIQAAEKCLSVIDGADSEGTSTGPSVSLYHVSDVSRISSNNRTESPGSRKSSKLSRNSSPRVPSHHSYEDGAAYAIRDLCLGSDYYLPPDASSRCSGGTPTSRTSLIPSRETMEKSGYWTQLTDSRIKSLKRRYVVFKNGQISFYRKHNNRDEEPASKISISDIRSVTKLEQQGAAYAFQLITSTDKMNFMTESERTTHDWVTILSAAIKATTLREMASRVTPIDASISGWLTRVKCGLSKKVFAALVNQKLMFFKNSNDLVPNGFLCLQGAQISEKHNGTEEYSGSSDEQLETTKEHPNQRKNNDSLCVQIANEDPVYLILRTSEDKEKWLYYLKSASGTAALCGTPFEILVQRMMAENVANDSPLWKDLLFASGEEIPKDTMTSVDHSDRKKTLEIARACQLFVSVLMRAQATQYHIDLAQNILSTAVQQEYLRNEVYSQLIKMTSGSMPFGLQGWKLLALTIPLFLPKQYSLLWLLKRHISRWVDLPNESDETRMAIFCESALDRCLRVGGRQEGPSRLEVTSVLTRDVTRTKFPHSISVKLPNSEYQIVEFDGSTEIGQCLSSLCLKLGMRPALLSGYALYMNDPMTHSLLLLKGKQKLCDALSTWETRSRDAQRGRVISDCAAALSLRMRHYWGHLALTETPIERQFLVWRASEEIVNGRIPLSNQLCESLAALYAQMVFGDANQSLSDQQFEFISQRFYPSKMLDVACIKSLRLQINSNWSELIGMSENECVRVILQVLGKWPLFGSDLHEASMRTDNERKIYLALNDHSVSLLDRRHFDVIRTIPYSSLSTFGQFQQDFMLTIIRPLTPGSHPDEAPKERLTFSMQKNEIEQLTLHLAEYIRCQKLVWKVSK